MATDSLTVVSAANYSQWSLTAGTRPSCIAEPDDGDTSRIGETTLNDIDTYWWSNISAESITSYGVQIRARHNDFGFTAGVVCIVLEYGVASTESSLITLSLTSYVDSDVKVLTKPGGGSWEPSDFDPNTTYETGVRRKDPRAGVNTVYVTTIDPQLTYVPGGGGLWECDFKWLPPLLPLVGLFGTCLAYDNKFMSWVKHFLHGTSKSWPTFDWEFALLNRRLQAFT